MLSIEETVNGLILLSTHNTQLRGKTNVRVLTLNDHSEIDLSLVNIENLCQCAF